ncbi:MAG TPA: non-homologous end-joining DNA ligase [Bryobacteraceae bacterium]|nr:non-homologous end-joining DNA ligase [Bryobacteraceae bacterium]
MTTRRAKAHFIKPMLLLRTDTLPGGPEWQYELKLDGYRALALKTDSKIQLKSRNNNDLSGRYPGIVRALAPLPNDTVVDGEVVAFDESGRPSFNTLQNYSSSKVPVFYFAFDLLILAGRDLRSETLETRRELLRTKILTKLDEPIRYSAELTAGLPDLIRSVREQGLEGLVGKRRNSVYEPGQRSGAWRKMRINRGQEFVIGGYTPSPKNFDALIFGYYEGSSLIYVARTRNGFTPRLRDQLFKRFRGLQIPDCPFSNVPERTPGRWGQGLTAMKMKECRWLKPVLVGQFEFVEWTPDDHLRHSRFVALREDKPARDVHRER